MSKEAESDGTDESLKANETNVREALPKLKETPAKHVDRQLPLVAAATFTESAVKAPLHDLNITMDVENRDLTRCDLLRVYAVDKTFTNVDFTHSNFASCYFRNCKFVDCNFTGAIFKETNFTRSSFSAGCKFEYSQWDKTQITPEILGNCLPSWENVAFALARALRVNFAQIGDSDGVKKAAAIEVRQQGQMLWDAAFSEKGYYRKRSKGLKRFGDACHSIWWLLVDVVWGHGESPLKVVFCAITVVAITAGCLWFFGPQPATFWGTFWIALGSFWGVTQINTLPLWAKIALTIVRYILFALFTASLIRRISRR